MKYLSARKPNQNGFTLIELMIATMVFSVVLLLCMAALVQISKHFYKGVSSTRTQETARSIMTTIAEAVQFGGGTIRDDLNDNGLAKGVCVDHFRFSYVPGYIFQGSGAPSDHGLVMEDVSSLGGCSSVSDAQDLTVANDDKELLQPRMQVQSITVVPLNYGNLYKVTVNLATAPDSTFLTGGRCKSEAGTQFCATTSLSTVVQKRVQ